MAERSSRDKDYSRLSTYRDDIEDLIDDVEQAFADKQDQLLNLERYWQCFNTELSVNQAYTGNSQIYVPIIRDAIEARTTRFVNMLFPETEQHVDVVSYGGDLPMPLMAILNHYVKKAKLRMIAPALLRNGEVEGHYSIYVDWKETTRYVTRKVEKPVEVDGIEDWDQTFLDIEDEEIEEGFPDVDIIPAADLAVFPTTVDNIEDDAEFVAIARRMTKGKIRQLARDGVFEKSAAKMFLKNWPSQTDPNAYQDIEKKKINAAGVKRGGKYSLIYEVWKKFKIDGERRWCRLFYSGPRGEAPLAFKINPNWNDRCSVISMPRVKISGSFWGKSPVDAVEQLQYAVNDACNMAWDSAQYSLLPIVMTDPQKNPNYGSMILSLASIWQTNPNDTKFVTFPQLWSEALQIVAEGKSQIMQSFSLNPAMMAQGAGAGKKPTQAQVAQDTAVAIETTANEVTTLEDGLFTPMLERFFEMDQQFRKTPMQVKIFGQLGVAAEMMEVPTFAWDDRYEFRWKGVASFKSAQRVQQMIAGMNILKSLPPVLPSGKRIELDPIVEVLVEETFGPRLGARILVDIRDQLSLDPEMENGLLHDGADIPVHQFDNDQEHLQSHTQAVKQQGDQNGRLRSHIQRHMAQLQRKQQAAQPGGLPGTPGQPGVAGTPRPGAQPRAPRGGQNPAGAIHSDQIQDPSRMPRPNGAGGA